MKSDLKIEWMLLQKWCDLLKQETKSYSDLFCEYPANFWNASTHTLKIQFKERKKREKNNVIYLSMHMQWPL